MVEIIMEQALKNIPQSWGAVQYASMVYSLTLEFVV